MNKCLYKAILTISVITLFSPSVVYAEKMVKVNASNPSEFISEAKRRIRKCEASYDTYVSIVKAQNFVNQLLQAQNGSPTETKPVEREFVQCSAQEKEEFVPIAKTFIKSIKAANTQKIAKDMVAQWITTIEAIGSQVSSAERAKFETLSNSLMLEF